MSNSKSGNQGISVTGGGTLIAGQAVAGKHARAIGGTLIQEASHTDLLRAVDSLQRLILEHKGRLDPHTVEASAALKQESSAPVPDKRKMKRILKTIGSGAKSFSSIIAAVASIKKLIDLVIP